MSESTNELSKDQGCHLKETSQLIYRVNQLIGIYLMGTSALMYHGQNLVYHISSIKQAFLKINLGRGHLGQSIQERTK